MKLHLPHLNKHLTLVTVTVLVAVGLFSWGIVRYEQVRKHNQAVAAQAKADNEHKATEQAHKLTAAQDQVTLLTTQKAEACTALKQLTTKPRVVYVAPTYCQ